MFRECSVILLLKTNHANSFHERHEQYPQGEVIRLKLSQEVSFLNRGAGSYCKNFVHNVTQLHKLS